MSEKKLLLIDLKTQTTEDYVIPAEDLKKFPGGRGLGIYCLEKWDEKEPLIFTTGAMGDTEMPSCVQWQVTAKSPLTEALGGAFAWGNFGIYLHRTGYLGLVITGRSDKPVVLQLDRSGKLSFRPAEDLWGMNTRAVTEALVNEYTEKNNNAPMGDGQVDESVISVAAIGPAGEQQAGIGCIIGDKFQIVIRTGMGCVMGAKQVKAVVIERGEFVPSENKAFVKAASDLMEQVRVFPASRRLNEQGKAMLIKSKNQVGDLPSCNHQYPTFAPAEHMDGIAMLQYTIKKVACEHCPIGCIRKTQTSLVSTEGPEYEPIWALGPRIGNGDLEYLINLYDSLMGLGIDPVAFAGVTSFAMECYQRGLLKSDIPLEWGSKEAIEYIRDGIAAGTGLGKELSMGTRGYYRKHPETKPYAMEVKGVEISGQEPRQSKAMGLSLSVANWGGDWGYGLPTIDVAQNEAAAKTIFPDCWAEVLDVTNEASKGVFVKFCEDYNAISDTMGICKFAAPETYATMPADMAACYSAFIGEVVTTEEFLKMGADIIQAERDYNRKHGLTKEDDYLPDRFLTEPIQVKLFEGNRLTGLTWTGKMKETVNDLKPMQEEYYRARGWDKE